MSRIRAFTLIELLIVIAIIAILGSATVLVLNPIELMKQGRDGTRINDTENIEKSIKMTLFNNPSLIDSLSPTNIYLSLPTGSCPTNPPSGYSYVCNATSANMNKVDGTGWIPLSLQNMATLPVDPNAGNNNDYYAFVADPVTKTFVITSLLESEKQTKLTAAKDGGTDPGRFEKGNPTLWANASGLMGYWPMDEGMGTTTADLSGNGNTGNVSGAWTIGKIVGGVNFDGSSSNNVDVANSTSLSFGTGSFSVSGWAFYRSYIYPRSSFIIKKSAQCYSDGAANAGFDIGHSYHPDGADICLRDANNAAIRTTLTFNSNQTPPNLQNKWSHYVFVFNRTTGRVIAYIDGIRQSNEINISSITGSVNNNNSLTMGTLYGWQTDGVMDDIRVYNRALTADEVVSMYNANK